MVLFKFPNHKKDVTVLTVLQKQMKKLRICKKKQKKTIENNHPLEIKLDLQMKIIVISKAKRILIIIKYKNNIFRKLISHQKLTTNIFLNNYKNIVLKNIVNLINQKEKLKI